MHPNLKLHTRTYELCPSFQCTPKLCCWERMRAGGRRGQQRMRWLDGINNSLDMSLSKEIKPNHLKGNQSWIFTRRTDAEAEVPIHWLPDTKSQFIRKNPDAGKDWRQKAKGMTEDKMAGWHHCLNWYEFEQATGDSEGQGSWACSSPRDCKHMDVTEQQMGLQRFRKDLVPGQQ